MTTLYRPLIGITLGDPKGIGPEVVLKAVRSPEIRRLCRPIIFGDPLYYDWKQAKRLSPREAGKLAGFFIEQAAHAAMTGQIDAVVTAPISKAHLHEAGYPYPGHTEMLAALSGAVEVRMMMASSRLRVVLTTIHEPLERVSTLLSVRKILQTIRITQNSLNKMFGLRRPRIAVAALNPHAGEGGLFGKEEGKKIEPAVRKARDEGIDAQGPLPADTLFHRAVKGEFDAVVVMYHDQGLIPIKMLDFDTAVNVTLGLPFIRTSVDHGTAFDIAGQGKANPENIKAAIRLAVEMSRSCR